VVYTFAATERKAFVHQRHTRDVSENNPFGRVMGRWEEVIDDMEVTAEEYRAEGWEVLELHPGDITVLNDERYGLDVLVPSDEYEEVETLATEATFDSYEVYRAGESEMTFVLIVLEDPDSGRAVCCPVYYDESETEELARRAHAEGVMYTHIRPLADDRVVTFTYENTDHFF
jgi:hypothetical protein